MNTNDTIVKLKGRLPEASSLDGMADKLYKDVGKAIAAAVEFVVDDRIEPNPNSDAHPVARLRILKIEVATDDGADEQLRTWMLDNYKARTAEGTLDLEHVEHSGDVVRTPTATSRSRRKS